MSEIVTLESIAENIASGLTPLRSNEMFWTNGVIYWLKTEQIGERYIFHTSELISLKALQETSIKLFPENSITIAMYGEGRTRGRVSILKEKMTTNQACCNIVLKKNLANYLYVYYYLRTQYDNIRSLSSGVRKNLNSKDIKEYKIPLPHILTQQKIASILSSLDDKIELNNKINDNLEQQAKLLYDYWFVQFEFPNEDGKPYKSSGGKMVYNKQLKREIPEGWEVKELKEIIEFNPKLDIKRDTIASYVDMYSIPNEGYMITDIQTKEYSGGIKFQNNDVLLARITPCLENGKTALVKMLEDLEVAFGSTEFIVMRGINRDFSSFISCLARTTFFRHYAIANMIGTSGRKRVDAKILELYKTALPKSINLLISFEKMTSKLFDIMGTNQKQNQQLSSLRDWLLPMLMNGQVKVE